jgi:hypothetical protein
MSDHDLGEREFDMTQFVTFVLLDNIVAYRFLFVVRLKFVGRSPSLSSFSYLFVRYWFTFRCIFQ